MAEKGADAEMSSSPPPVQPRPSDLRIRAALCRRPSRSVRAWLCTADAAARIRDGCRFGSGWIRASAGPAGGRICAARVRPGADASRDLCSSAGCAWCSDHESGSGGGASTPREQAHSFFVEYVNSLAFS